MTLLFAYIYYDYKLKLLIDLNINLPDTFLLFHILTTKAVHIEIVRLSISTRLVSGGVTTLNGMAPTDDRGSKLARESLIKYVDLMTCHIFCYKSQTQCFSHYQCSQFFY